MLTSGKTEAVLDVQDVVEITQKVNENVIDAMNEARDSTFYELREALIDVMLSGRALRRGDIREALDSCVAFILPILCLHDLAHWPGLDYFSVALWIPPRADAFFTRIATVLDNIRKRGSIALADRTDLIQVLRMMNIIVGPVFSMRLHQLIVESVRNSIKWYSLVSKDGFLDAIRQAALCPLRSQKILFSGALTHLAAITAYWLQQLGVPDQDDLLEGQRLAKWGIKGLRTEQRQRNTSEDTRMFYGRLKRCEQFQMVDDNLELLDSFSDAEVDRMIELADPPDPESKLEYSYYAAMNFVATIIEEETGITPYDFPDDESGSKYNESESKDDSDSGQSCDER